MPRGGDAPLRRKTAMATTAVAKAAQPGTAAAASGGPARDEGTPEGDRIAIVGSNRPRLYWAFCAAQSLKAIPVPVYADSVADELAYVLNHAGARFAIVQDQEQVDKLLSVQDKVPKLATLMDTAEEDVLAYMTFPEQHRTKLHSTNPLERLNKEVKRRADVVGIFPNEDSITRLIGAVLLEQNDEYQLQNRYMQIEGMTALATPQIEEVPPLQITPKAA